MIGRAKPDSVELDDKPADSHVASTDQDRFGKIFRRNMPYGTVTDHGTMFVGFSCRAAAARDHAGKHGGTGQRRPRRPYSLHATGHRCVLLRSVDGLAGHLCVARPRNSKMSV